MLTSRSFLLNVVLGTTLGMGGNGYCGVSPVIFLLSSVATLTTVFAYTSACSDGSSFVWHHCRDYNYLPMSTTPLRDSSIYWKSDESFIFSYVDGALTESARKQLLAYSDTFWFGTSGSVRRKWVGLSKDGVLASARAVNKHLRVDEKDCWALCLPIEHVGGFSIHARSGESQCRVIELLGEWDPARAHALLREESCTLVSLVPTQLYDLVALSLKAPPTLRVALIGGASFDPFLRERALTLGWPVVSTYGSTEASSQIACQSLDTIFDPTLPPLEVLPHIKVRTNIEGVLEISGPSVVRLIAHETMGGGLEISDPQHGGWYSTSDRVELTWKESTQLLCMLGRADRKVKILGELVSLDVVELEVKNYLRTRNDSSSGGIPNIILMSAPDDRRGLALHLLVEDLTDIQLDLEALNMHLGGLKRIAVLHRLRSFPRLVNNKIDMKALAELILA